MLACRSESHPSRFEVPFAVGRSANTRRSGSCNVGSRRLSSCQTHSTTLVRLSSGLLKLGNYLEQLRWQAVALCWRSPLLRLRHDFAARLAGLSPRREDGRHFARLPVSRAPSVSYLAIWPSSYPNDGIMTVGHAELAADPEFRRPTWTQRDVKLYTSAGCTGRRLQLQVRTPCGACDVLLHQNPTARRCHDDAAA